MPKRIGIYAGTFDPIHSGHLALALQALDVGNLDVLYFMPERRPRAKPNVEHFGHRVAMLQRALKPHPSFDILEMVDTHFSIERTLPKLRKQYNNEQLVFLFGSDVVKTMYDWPNIDRLLTKHELLIGLRNDDSRSTIKNSIEKWECSPHSITIFDSYAPLITSGKIRTALRKHQATKGLLKSVEKYSDHHWLYISLGNVDIP